MSKNRLPSLHRHASGQAFVRVREHGTTKDIYLGRYGSAEARSAYGALLAAFVAGEAYEPAERKPARDTAGPTIDELLVTYWHEEIERRSNNVQLKVRLSMVPLRKLYGDTQANAFGPRALASVRDTMVKSGRLSRGEINERVQNVRTFFRWCVSRELIGPSVAHALDALANLRAGEVRGLREPRVIGAAKWPDVEAALVHLSSPLRAAVLVQWWSGARAGEILQMRAGDVDRSTNPWRFTPATHKTQRFGRGRVIFVGPQAQAALAPMLLRCDPTEYVFKPADALEEQRQAKRTARRSPMTPSQRAREAARSRHRLDQIGERYATTTYNRACARAIADANAVRKLAKMRQALCALLPADRHEDIGRACERAPHMLTGRVLDRIARLSCGPETARKAAVRKALEDIVKEPGEVRRWSVHMLRHAAATRIEASSLDFDGTRCVLGHTSLDVTRLYVERDERRAAALVAKLG